MAYWFKNGKNAKCMQYFEFSYSLWISLFIKIFSVVVCQYNINNNSAKSKKLKSESDFASIILDSYNHLCQLFPESSHPKTQAQKIQWLETIDQCNRLDKIDPRQLWNLCKKAREDDFWQQNFLSLVGIRIKKNGVSKLDRFKNQFKLW